MKTKAEKFTDWARDNDAEVEIVQEDDGSGYTIMAVTLPHLWDGITFNVTVNED